MKSHQSRALPAWQFYAGVALMGGACWHFVDPAALPNNVALAFMFPGDVMYDMGLLNGALLAIIGLVRTFRTPAVPKKRTS